MIIEQIYTGCLSQGAYYIESNGEAAIIDPLREVDQYILKAKKNKASIKYIFETHFHADFVSGHLTLSKKTNAPIIYGPNANTSFESINAKDGQRFILKYGHSLNGYSDVNQLYRVYGLDSIVVDRIKEAFEIKPDTIIPMNIRLASREELNTLPYLSQSEIDWLISLRNRPEGLGSKEFVTNLLLKTLNKNKKLLVYLTY